MEARAKIVGLADNPAGSPDSDVGISGREIVVTQQATPVRGRTPVPVASIGKSVLMKGELSGGEDLCIAGQVEGVVELPDHNVLVDVGGQVRANITAKDVVVSGTVKGNIHAINRVQIRKTGIFIGDLIACRVVIEDGAYFRGSIQIRRPEDAEIEAASELPGNIQFPTVPDTQYEKLLSRFHELVDKKLEGKVPSVEWQELKEIELEIDACEKRQNFAIDRASQEIHSETMSKLTDLISELRTLSIASGNKARMM